MPSTLEETRQKRAMTPEDQWLLKKEQVLAWLRAGFALLGLIVIQSLEDCKVPHTFPCFPHRFFALQPNHSVSGSARTDGSKANRAGHDLS
jgi:hypothetical protein